MKPGCEGGFGCFGTGGGFGGFGGFGVAALVAAFNRLKPNSRRSRELYSCRGSGLSVCFSYEEGLVSEMEIPILASFQRSFNGRNSQIPSRKY